MHAVGLGKTVQAIAVLAQRLDEGDRGPHLVVAPTSLLENWRRELAQWCPSVATVVYTGAEAARAALREKLSSQSVEADVLVCS